MHKQHIRILMMLKIMRIFHGEKILYNQMLSSHILGKKLK
nr:MAG TPA: hypothetical protein [Bacteriophage sp.]